MASVPPGFVFSTGLMVGFVTLGIISARNRRRHRRSATAVQLADGQTVTFEAARRGVHDNRRVQLNALIFVGYGIWAAVLTVHGAPMLGPIAAVVLFEMALAMFRLSTITGSTVTDEAAAARVAPLLNEICGRASCPVPRVMLRDDTVRAAAVRRLRKQMTVVLSRSYVNSVDDQALRALLAHEVIHILRDDLSFARLRAWASILVGAVLAGITAALTHPRGIAGMPIWLAVAVFGIMGTNVGLSPLNRPREQRADDEGAQLAGDPNALARALAQAHALSDETRLRLFGRPPWRWLLSPLSWRMPTHPPMEKRIARLEAMAQSASTAT